MTSRGAVLARAEFQGEPRQALRVSRLDFSNSITEYAMLSYSGSPEWLERPGGNEPLSQWGKSPTEARRRWVFRREPTDMGQTSGADCREACAVLQHISCQGFTMTTFPGLGTTSVQAACAWTIFLFPSSFSPGGGDMHPRGPSHKSAYMHVLARLRHSDKYSAAMHV